MQKRTTFYLQPIDLLPSSLSDYCAAFPDLPRVEVLSIFREEETEREEQLARCREVRRGIMREQGDAGGDIDENGKGSMEVKRMRKKSCLSPIVEQKVGRDESPDARRQGK